MVTSSSAMTIVEQLGRFPSHARRGELFPGFMLPAIDGSSVSLESYRGRTNLIVVFAGDKVDQDPVAVLLEELVARREEFTRFREIFAAYLPGHGLALPGAKEILDWLVFINIQCPECGVPEWPT